MQRSILNCLLDLPQGRSAPGGRADPVEIAEAIRSDLEDLLNTRNHHSLVLAKGYPEVAASILGYGMPDADAIRMTSENEVVDLRDRIKKVIEMFEPRLENVQVKILEAPRPFTQEIVLEIRASVRVRDYEEQVVWNSTLKGGMTRLARS